MPRALKLLPLLLSLAAPVCARAAAHPARQTPPAAQQSPTNDEQSERGKRLLAQGDTLLKLYVGESERVNEQYPMPPDANEETRRPVFEKREAALAHLKARMRAAADSLEEWAGSQPAGAPREEALELAETLRVYGSEPGRPSVQVFRQAEVTTKARLTYRSEPGITQESRRNNVRGVVRLRAVLAADGRVKNIIVIRGLPDGLTEKAIEAARQIRFTPATKAGRAVSQFVILEYNFNF